MIVEQKVLSAFWMPDEYYNTISTGCNCYTIRKYGKQKQITEEQFDKLILPQLNVIPFPSYMTKLPCSNQYPEGFREIINDALEDVRKGKQGILFNLEQVRVFLGFLPHSKVEKIDDYYYIRNR